MVTIYTRELTSGLKDTQQFYLYIDKPANCEILSFSRVESFEYLENYEYTIGGTPIVIPFPEYKFEPEMCIK